ncbi:MAG: hypothetical protein H7246_23105 [Phycisphaerae bacterium]|nr:hypothetical protein [Saprospiraceae bacterium]
MMYSIDDASLLLPKAWYACSGGNLVMSGIFYVVMFNGPNQRWSGDIFLIVVGLAVALGIILGLYVKYRTEFSPLYSIVIQHYFFILFDILFGGSVIAFAMTLSGRPDLRWFAFNANAACMVLTLVISIFLTARDMGVWDGTNSWRQRIEKYIDYSKRQVSPTLTSDTVNYKKIAYPHLIIGAGIGTIPLLFQIFTGNRQNVMFFAAPLLTLTLTYMTFKTIGPAHVRIFLLRKIEKEQGYRFQNADYEKIQELRRGFFMARWLMKDYRSPIVAKLDKKTMNMR